MRHPVVGPGFHSPGSSENRTQWKKFLGLSVNPGVAPVPVGGADLCFQQHSEDRPARSFIPYWYLQVAQQV